MHRAWSLVSLALLLAVAAPHPTARAADPAGPVYEMEVMGVAPDPASGTPLVYLRAKQDKRELSMFIGAFEAQGIILPLQTTRPPRPYTHDLMLEALHRLKAKVKQVVITELRDNIYYASLVVEAQGQDFTLDARPSDAIALALRENAPILAAEKAFARPRRSRGSGPAEGGTP